MNKLSIEKLKFEGYHGARALERKEPQPFVIDVSVEYDFERSMKTDRLSDTVDYKTIEKVTKEIIEGPSQKLIEKLASDIADEVLLNTKSTKVAVTLTKPAAKSVGIPSIYIEKNIQEITDRRLFTITREQIDAFYSEKTDGVMVLKGVLSKMLSKETIETWLRTRWPDFEKKEEKYIENNQEVGVVYDGPFDSLFSVSDREQITFHRLYHTIRSEIRRYSDIPFNKGDRLQVKCMKYTPSKIGIAPHKDMSSDRNLIVIMNLYGSTTFYTAKDKERGGEKAYKVGPGDVLIMRAPRNKSERNLRPIHYVLEVKEERAVLIFREIDSVVEAVINKDNWLGF